MTARSFGLLLVALAAVPSLPAAARAQGDLRGVRLRAAAPASLPHDSHWPRPLPPWTTVWGLAWTGWGSGLAATAAAAAPATPPAPPRRVPPTRVIAVGADEAAPAGRVLAERVAGGRVRVRWAVEGAPPAGETSLVLADAARGVFATLRPAGGTWTAEFADDPRAAFAGLLLVRPDGASTTTLVPLSPR